MFPAPVLKLFRNSPGGATDLSPGCSAQHEILGSIPNLTQPRQGRLIFSQGETLGLAPPNIERLAPCRPSQPLWQKQLQPITSICMTHYTSGLLWRRSSHALYQGPTLEVAEKL